MRSCGSETSAEVTHGYRLSEYAERAKGSIMKVGKRNRGGKICASNRSHRMLSQGISPLPQAGTGSEYPHEST